MKLVRNLILALTLVASAFVVAPQSATAQGAQEIQQIGAWSAEFQRLVGAFLAPLQNPPQPPVAGMTRPHRLAWAGATREWARNAQTRFVEVRAGLDRMPPFPTNEGDSVELRNAIQASVVRLRDSIDAGDRIASAYMSLADAVERNQMGQVTSIRRVALESTMVTMRLFQDINATQAAAIEPGNPNRSLLMSYAYSYEALWMMVNFKYEAANGVDNRAVAANTIASAAMRMRAVIAAGRAETQLLQTQLGDPAIAATVDPAVLPRFRAMIAAFPASFALEEELANDLDVLVAILRRSGDFASVEPDFDAQMAVFGEREGLRTADLARRTAIMTAP